MGDSWLETNGTVAGVNQTRIERDPLGELMVPAGALWGVQTERARQNFPISSLRPLPAFVDAVVRIKKAAALTHKETGRLDPKLADAIIKAADEVLDGRHRDDFVVDPYQAGAGTSHNIATRCSPTAPTNCSGPNGENTSRSIPTITSTWLSPRTT